MNWLVKEEPDNYSFAQFAKDGSTVWAGVRNPVAQRNLREMKKGDRVFFYHTGKEKAIVGTATVAKTSYPDPNDKTGRLVVVELAAGKALEAARHLERNQGRQALRDHAAGAHRAPVGAAGQRRRSGT